VISEENKNELRRIVSEARLSGVAKKDIQKLVDEYYSGK
jgi:DNA-binding transcriptional regulator YhcF (GntR family)